VSCWLITQLHDAGPEGVDIAALCRAYDVPLEVAERAQAELVDRGLVTVDGSTVTGLTPEGHQIAERLIAERRASMERLLDGWSAGDPDLAELLTRLARQVGREPPHPQEVAEPVAAGTAAGG
jgi:hypothetical protein